MCRSLCLHVINVNDWGTSPSSMRCLKVGFLKWNSLMFWGIDFIWLFPPSHNNLYILVAVDYVSKWTEAITTPVNNSKVVIKFLKKHIFTWFGTLRALLSDNGTCFRNKPLVSLLKRYWVFYKVVTPNHPQQLAEWSFPIINWRAS